MAKYNAEHMVAPEVRTKANLKLNVHFVEARRLDSATMRFVEAKPIFFS